jgi:hypothetical protein
MRRWASVVVAGLAGVLLVSCSDGGPGPGEARLEVDGEAVIERAGGARETIADATETLRRGDEVEITRGTGRLALHGGGRLELRAAVGDGDNTRLTLDDTPVLDAGDLLVLPGDEAVAIDAADTAVRVDGGAGRLSRYLGLGVEMYDGTARIDSAGVERDVPRLRRLDVAVVGRPARELRPIGYDQADPWDRRFLGEAIAYGERLENLSARYTASLRPGEGRSVGFYRLVLPGLDDERDLDQQLLDAPVVPREPGERLVGAAISELGTRGTFTERWSSVFGFRTQGAAWGIVALDQAVSGDPLLGTVQEALRATDTAFDFAAPESSAPTTPSTAGTEPDPGEPSTPTTPPPTTPPPTAPPTVPPPEEPGPLDPVIDVVEPVEDLVDGLLDGLLGAGP